MNGFRRYKETALIWGVVILALSGVPLFYGYINEPPRLNFLGYTDNAPDTCQYLSWVEQARRGGWLFKNPYALEPHKAIFFHPLFLLIGKLASLTKLSNIFVYQIVRFASAALLLVVCFRVCQFFFGRNEDRIFCYFLITVTGGLSWLSWFFPTLSEKGHCLFSATFRAASSTFWSLYINPLFPLSIALLLLCFLNFLYFIESLRYRYSIYSGLCLLFLAQLHPFNVVTVLSVLLCTVTLLAITNKRLDYPHFLGYSLMVLTVAPYLIYLKWILLKEPVFDAWSKAVVYPPGITGFICLYGFLLLFSILAVPTLFKRPTPKHLFLISWFVLVPVMSGLDIHPPNISVRVIEGYHIVLCILSTGVISRILVGWQSNQTSRVLTSVFIIGFLSLGNVWVIAKDIQKLNKHYIDYYLPDDMMKAIMWIKENSGVCQAVLASDIMGLQISALAGNSVFLGHFAQTTDWKNKHNTVQKYFSDRNSEQDRRQLLEAWGIRYVFYSPLEQKIGGYNPDTSSYLVPVYRNKTVSIYEYRT